MASACWVESNDIFGETTSCSLEDPKLTTKEDEDEDEDEDEGLF
jgi:hypothetical protein